MSKQKTVSVKNALIFMKLINGLFGSVRKYGNASTYYSFLSKQFQYILPQRRSMRRSEKSSYGKSSFTFLSVLTVKGRKMKTGKKSALVVTDLFVADVPLQFDSVPGFGRVLILEGS